MGRTPLAVCADSCGVGMEPIGPCNECGHLHRVRRYSEDNREVLYDEACAECACVASGVRYSGKLADIFAIKRPAADLVGADRGHDDDHDVCPVHHLAGACAELGHGDAGAAHPMERRGPLRRGWLDRIFWSGVSKFAWHLGSELVGKRGDG